MNHDDLKGLVPLFALDALIGQDEAAMVSHLKVCRECAESLTEHRETAGMLGLAAGSIQAPPALKERIMQQAARSPQLKQAAPVPIHQARSHRRSWQWVGVAAAFVFVLLAGTVVVNQLMGQNDEVARQQIVIAQQRQALSVISSPSSVVLTMSATDHAPGVNGKVFISDQEQAAAVVLSGFEDPGREVYTLWLIADGNRRPVTDFVPEDGLALIPVPSQVGSDATLAVTREPRPGNTSPRGPVMLAAYRA